MGVAMEAHTQVEVVVGRTGGVVRYIMPETELPINHQLESSHGTVVKLNSRYINSAFLKHTWSLCCYKWLSHIQK